MSYATVEDMRATFPERDLVALTNEDGAATSINSTPLQRQLDDATLLIDSYLIGRFALPFATGTAPAILGILCRDIAMYRLQALRPIPDTEDARKRYEDALKTLREIRDGDLTLGLNPQAESPTITTPTVMTEGPGLRRLNSQDLSQVFDRRTLRVW